MVFLKKVFFFLSGIGFENFFGRLDPRVKQEDATCHFPNSFLFIFLLFPFFALKNGFLFFEEDSGKTHSHKKRSCRAQEVDFVFQRACFCLVVQGKHVGGAASSSFLTPLRPSFFRVVVLGWCCLVCSFFWWWCFLSLLWVVLLSRSPSFRKVLHFPSFFGVVLLGPLEWCFLPSV